MICVFALVACIAFVDFHVAFWGAAARVWDEAQGRYDEPVVPPEIPAMYRRVQAVTA